MPLNCAVHAVPSQFTTTPAWFHYYQRPRHCSHYFPKHQRGNCPAARDSPNTSRFRCKARLPSFLHSNRLRQRNRARIRHPGSHTEAGKHPVSHDRSGTALLGQLDLAAEGKVYRAPVGAVEPRWLGRDGTAIQLVDRERTQLARQQYEVQLELVGPMLTRSQKARLRA